MENLLGQMYCWFQSFFGQNLSYYLWGYDPSTQGFTNANLFNTIGLITLVISLIVIVLYYYVFNHPKYCKWWSWLITIGLNSVIALFVGYGMVKSKYVGGYIPEELMYVFDEEGNVTQVLIGESHCWGLGMANIFISLIFAIVLSFILKWWSANAKHVPF